MTEKTKLIDHFKLYVDSLKSLGRPLQKAEILKFQALAKEISDLDRTEKALANMQRKFQLLKMQASIQQLKLKHLAA